MFKKLAKLLILALFLIIMPSSCGSGASISEIGQLSITGNVSTLGFSTLARVSTPNSFWNFEIVSPAYAQEIEGTPLADALVELLDINGIVIDSAMTDENGDFQFFDVPSGTYSIQVTEASINPLTVDNIVVLDGDTAVIRGTVTADGADANVDFVVDTCEVEADNPAQLAHATAIADAAEVSVEEVLEQREVDCLGWGLIAQNFEIHPSILGIGNDTVRGGGRPEEPGNSDSAGNGGGRPDDLETGPPEDRGQGKPEGVGNGRPENPGNSG